MSDTSEGKMTRQGLMTVVGCCLVLACIGGGSTMANVVLPSVSNALGASMVQVGLQPFVSTLTAFLSGLAGAKFLNYLTPRWAMLAGVFGAAICTFIIAAASNLPMFIISGVFSGFALSCTFAPIASLMSLHFKKDSGKWFGLTTGAQVFVVAGIVKIAGYLFKTYDYRTVMYGMTVAILAIGISLCLLLIKQPKRSVMIAEVKRLAAEKAESDSVGESASGAVDEFTQGLSIKEALTKPALYLFGIGMIVGAIITGSMSTYGSSFFVMFGMDQAAAADMMSLYTLFCGVHVLWTGFFQAKFGSRIFIIVQYVAIIIGVALLVLWADNQSTIFVVVGLLLVAFIKPINSTPALLIPDLFGRKHYLAFNSLSTGIYYAGVCISTQSTAIIMTALGGARAFLYMGAMACVAIVVFLAAIALSPMKKLKGQSK